MKCDEIVKSLIEKHPFCEAIKRLDFYVNRNQAIEPVYCAHVRVCSAIQVKPEELSESVVKQRIIGAIKEAIDFLQKDCEMLSESETVCSHGL